MGVGAAIAIGSIAAGASVAKGAAAREESKRQAGALDDSMRTLTNNSAAADAGIRRQAAVDLTTAQRESKREYAAQMAAGAGSGTNGISDDRAQRNELVQLSFTQDAIKATAEADQFKSEAQFNQQLANTSAQKDSVKANTQTWTQIGLGALGDGASGAATGYTAGTAATV